MEQSGLNNPPLIGRSREIKIFRSVLADLDEGTGSCVLIRGLSGTGKTRLLSEFAALAGSQGRTVISVRLMPSLRQKPYGAIVLILDEYLRRAASYPAERRAGLAAHLSRGADAIVPTILELHPGYAALFSGRHPASRDGSSHMEDPARLSGLMRVFLSNLASFENGAVVVLDDIHCADRVSLSLLEQSASRAGSMSLVIAAAYHQSMADDARRLFPSLFDGTGDVYEIQAEPLDPASHRRFCAGLVGADEESAKELSSFVYDATKGNPLFSHEAVRYLMNKGALSVRDGGVIFSRTAAPSLYQFGSYLTAARRNAAYLSAPEKEILSVMSVFGMRFSDEWLEVFLPRCAAESASHLASALDNARTLDFISRTEDGWRWNHAEVRDSCYEAADPVFRRGLHRDIARYLKEKGQGSRELLFDTAYHFMNSGIDDESLSWALAAGEKALEVFAYDAARDFFSFCSDAAPSGKRGSKAAVFRARVLNCAVLLAQGSSREAIGRLEELLSAAPEDGRCEVIRYLSLACFRVGETARCEELTMEGLRLLGEKTPTCSALYIFRQRLAFCAAGIFRRQKPLSGERLRRAQAALFFWGNMARLYGPKSFYLFLCAVLRMRTLSAKYFGVSADRASSDMALAGALMTSRRFRMSLRYLRSALRTMKDSGNEWETAHIGQLMGTLHLWRGNNAGAEADLLDAADRFEAMGDVSALCASLFPLAELYIATARYTEARRAARKAYDLASAAQNHFSRSRSAGQLAMIEAETGDAEAARRWIEASSDAASKAESRVCDFFLHYVQSAVFLRTGEFEAAAESSEKARRMLRFCRITGYYASALVPVELEAAAGRGVRLRGWASRLLLVIRYCRWSVRRAELFFALGQAFLKKGNVRRASFFLRRALKHAETLGRRKIAARAHYRLGEAALRRNRGAAIGHFERSFFICEECGSSSDADSVLGRIAELGVDPSRGERLTSRRRLDFVLAAQALSSVRDDSAAEKLLERASVFCRASAGAVYVADEELFPLERIAVRGATDDALARFARDVYTSEETAVRDGMIGIPLSRDGNVSGALCLQGCAPWMNAFGMMEALSSGIAVASQSIFPVTESTSARSGRRVSGGEERLNTVMEYIRQNYRDDISREGLASLVGLHPDNLGKMFKVRTGKKIGDFINSMRIEEAMGMLSGSETPVVDIAFAVGFESLRTFNRSFSAFAGVTPSAYREMAGKRKKSGQNFA